MQKVHDRDLTSRYEDCLQLGCTCGLNSLRNSLRWSHAFLRRLPHSLHLQGIDEQKVSLIALARKELETDVSAGILSED